MEEFITVAIFYNPNDIQILKHLLDQEGVAYFFENEATASVAPFYSVALGGIRLKIHPNDTLVVKAILSLLDDADLKIV